MIGNESDAALAYNEWLIGDFEHLWSSEGSSRYVFLIDGVIYKVNITPQYDFNDREYANYCEWAGNLPENVRIPEMSLYRVADTTVIASEFIEGIDTGDCSDSFFGLPCTCDGVCMPKETVEILNDMGWVDDSWGNAIVRDGIYYLVDIAC